MLRTRMSALAVVLFLVSPAAADWFPNGSAIHDYPNDPPPSVAGYPLDDFTPGYYGGGRYREYYAFGRGYGLADFPPPLPQIPYARPYRSYRVSATAVPGGAPVLDEPGRAYIEMRVPDDAEVWLEDAKTKQVGATRLFISPPLAPAQNFGYDVRVRWQHDGRTVEEKRTITVRAGQHVLLQIPAPTPEMLPQPAPVPPSPGR
jgi:uncharacterized protein (TIGR03000 family)